MMWNLSMLFYELRLFISFTLWFYFLYRSKIISSLIQQYLLYLGRKYIKLPIEIDELDVDLRNGTAVISGIRVCAPPEYEDDRWTHPYIVTISSVTCTFPVIPCELFTVLTNSELIFVRNIIVDQLIFYVEGFHTTDDHTQFNISLLGRSKTKDIPSVDVAAFRSNICVSQPQQEIPIAVLIPDTSNNHDQSCSSTSQLINSNSSSTQSLEEVQNEKAVPLKSDSASLIIQSTSESNTQQASRSFLNVSKMISRANDAYKNMQTMKETVSGIGQKITTTVSELKNEVKEAGIINATKKKMKEAYIVAKKTVKKSIDNRFAELHAKLSGPEPVPIPGDARLICDFIEVNHILIFMSRALPVHLRHLEQKPLVVEKIKLSGIGLEGLPRKQKPPMKHPVEVTNPIVSDEKQRQMEKKIESNVKAMKGMSEALGDADDRLSGQHGENGRRSLLTSNPSETVKEELMLIDDVDLWTMKMFGVGMDLNLVRYRFERALLSKVCQGNAGRLLSDAFLGLYSFGMTSSASLSHLSDEDQFVEFNPHGDDHRMTSESKSGYQESNYWRFNRDDSDIISTNPLFFDT